MYRKSGRFGRFCALSFCAAAILAVSPAAGAIGLLPAGAPYASIGAGVFNAKGDVRDGGYNGTPAELDADYPSGFRYWGVGYMFGLLANTDGGVDGYAGLYGDIVLTHRLLLVPEAAVSGYRRGGSKRMGSGFLFRLELGLAYQLAGGDRIGVQVAHLSNGDLFRRNPGENEVLVFCSLPLG